MYVALLFLIPSEKNLEQREMATKVNKQEQRWWHNNDTRRPTNESEEMGADQSSE